MPDLETPEVGSVEDVLSVIARGEAARATEATDMNEVSSRSHSLLMVYVAAKTADGVNCTWEKDPGMKKGGGGCV